MDPENIIVNTVLGPVRGNQRISYLGDRFLSFRGIPYAQPPIGKLRFRVKHLCFNKIPLCLCICFYF